MDYKELIDKLRYLSGVVPEDMCDDGKDSIEKAADAIETLLKERDLQRFYEAYTLDDATGASVRIIQRLTA